MNARKQPPPDTSALTQQLGERFHLSETPPSSTPSSTPSTSTESQRVRRTYYFSRDVADELEALAARIHYGSHGQVPKHAAYDEIIRAGLEHATEIEARHQPSDE